MPPKALPRAPGTSSGLHFRRFSEDVGVHLGRFSEDLSALQKAVRWEDSKTLHKIFSRTRKVREKIISAGQDTDAVDFGRSNTRKKISKIKNRKK